MPVPKAFATARRFHRKRDNLPKEDLRDLVEHDRALYFAELALREFFNASWEVANDTGEWEAVSPIWQKADAR